MVKKGRSLSKVVWPSSSSGPMPRQAAKIGRNEPCPCGSGKKYKDCHREEGDAFIKRLAREEAKQERKERHEREGVPWWKRPFTP